MVGGEGEGIVAKLAKLAKLAKAKATSGEEAVVTRE